MFEHLLSQRERERGKDLTVPISKRRREEKNHKQQAQGDVYTSTSASTTTTAAKMTDEIRVFHVDDPNDAPDRRNGTFPTINPFIPSSLPPYVRPEIQEQLRTAMQFYFSYSAYQQGIAVQKQQQLLHQHQQQQLLHQQQQLLHQHQQQQLLHQHQHQQQLLQQQLQQRQLHHQQHQQHHQQQGSPASSIPSIPSVPSSIQSITQQQSPQQTQPPIHQQTHDHQTAVGSPSTSSAASVAEADSSQDAQTQHKPPHQHIKKPLNPFMIYMQKRRPEIVKQGLIKESAAINQLLGQQWRKLSKEEQEPYYKLAEQEKILHAQKYPGWSARDNYANQKKRKKLRLKSISLNGQDNSDKKCRARFGLNNLDSWCKPCKRKKKCIYATPSGRHSDHSHHNNHHHHHHHHHNHLNHLNNHPNHHPNHHPNQHPHHRIYL